MINKELKWDLDVGLETNRRYLTRMLNWPGLLEQQKQKLAEFDKDCAIAGIRITSRASYINYLKDFALFVNKPFDQVTKEDVKNYFCNLIDQKLSEHTKKNRMIAIKKYYQWAYGMKKGQYPEIVSWLQPRMRYSYKLPEDIPTVDDVKTIIDKGCTELSHKALISVLAELALRATEIISPTNLCLKIKKGIYNF